MDICVPFIIMHIKIPSLNLKYYHLQYLHADRIAVKLPTGVQIKVLRKRVMVSQTLTTLICGLMQQFTYKWVFSTSLIKHDLNCDEFISRSGTVQDI